MVGCIDGALLGWHLDPDPTRAWAWGMEDATSHPPVNYHTTIKPQDMFKLRYFD